MKKILTIIFLVLFAIGLSSCSASSDKTTIDTYNEQLGLLKAPIIDDNDDYMYYESAEFKSFVDKMESFGNKLSEEFSNYFNEGQNICVSPLSIYMALSLAVECSYGETRDELLNALGVTYEELTNNVPYIYKLFSKEFYTQEYDSTKVKLVSKRLITNSIWFDDDIPLKEDCLDSLANGYKCYSYKVDFDGDNEEANKLIREFVKHKTNGLIDQDFKIPVDTAFALINTFYLKDVWSTFGKDLLYSDQEYEFTNNDLSTISKNLLMGHYSVGKADRQEKYTAYSQYTKYGHKLTFFMPNDGYSMKDIYKKEILDEITNLTYEREDTKQLIRYNTRCIFPEFETSSNESILKIIRDEFDVKNLFNASKCDYSNLTDIPTYCKDIKHVTKLKVDKTGVEGAAVTIVQNAATSIEPEIYNDVYYDFIVDRAFGFILSYKDVELFCGIVNKIN